MSTLYNINAPKKPTNLTVNDATAYETSLNYGSNVTIQTNNATGSDEGNIYINDSITWSTAQELTLNAGNNIYINKEITATNDSGKLSLKYGQNSPNGEYSDYYINAKVNLKAGQNY